MSYKAQILPVEAGGIGAASLTQYQVLVGNGNSAIASISVGTSGQVLTSNGAGSNPSFQTISVSGISDYKNSVRVATTAALDANTRSGNVLTADANGALPSIDGVPLSTSDRILVKDEAIQANNGIYTVTSLGDGSNPWVLTRSGDADTSSEVTNGLYTFCGEGADNEGNGYVLATHDPITLNTTALEFILYTAIPTSVAPLNATYVTLSTNGSLTSERVLTGTANQVVVTDNGAGSTVVLSLPQSIATTSNVTFGSIRNDGAEYFNFVASTAGDYTVLADDRVIIKTGITSGGDAIFLPPAATAGAGRILTIKDAAGAGTDNITITPDSGETIDIDPSFVMDVTGGSVTIICDGSDWFVL